MFTNCEVMVLTITTPHGVTSRKNSKKFSTKALLFETLHNYEKKCLYARHCRYCKECCFSCGAKIPRSRSHTMKVETNSF